VCGLFSLMNRLVDGLGVTADADYLRIAAARLASIGYAGLKELILRQVVRRAPVLQCQRGDTFPEPGCGGAHDRGMGDRRSVGVAVSRRPG
jgi:hypothetical protein